MKKGVQPLNLQRYVEKTTKKSEEYMVLFLTGLAEGWSVTKASAAAGISSFSAYKWRRDDEKFAKRWELAVEQGTDRLEDEAFRRAYEGVERPVYQGGQLVGTVTERSDRLMEFLLKGRRRSKYGDKLGVHGGDPGDEPVKISAVVRIIVGPDGKVIEHGPSRSLPFTDTDG